jgi:hypothetical protein
VVENWLAEQAPDGLTMSILLPKTTIYVRRVGYDWGINHDGSLVDRHQSQARAVIAAAALAERLRLAGHQVEMRFDGGTPSKNE